MCHLKKVTGTAILVAFGVAIFIFALTPLSDPWPMAKRVRQYTRLLNAGQVDRISDELQRKDGRLDKLAFIFAVSRIGQLDKSLHTSVMRILKGLALDKDDMVRVILVSYLCDIPHDISVELVPILAHDRNGTVRSHLEEIRRTRPDCTEPFPDGKDFQENRRSTKKKEGGD